MPLFLAFTAAKSTSDGDTASSPPAATIQAERDGAELDVPDTDAAEADVAEPGVQGREGGGGDHPKVGAGTGSGGSSEEGSVMDAETGTAVVTLASHVGGQAWRAHLKVCSLPSRLVYFDC